MGTSKITWTLGDKGGRRSDADRRYFSYSDHIPERRHQADRRMQEDRRCLPDRRSAKRDAAGMMEEKGKEDKPERLMEEAEHSFPEARTLGGIITICALCKKIRDDEGLWEQLEKYLHNRLGVDFSHGLCPECVKLYTDKVFDSPKNDSIEKA